jgi:hypothetical protein
MIAENITTLWSSRKSLSPDREGTASLKGASDANRGQMRLAFYQHCELAVSWGEEKNDDCMLNFDATSTLVGKDSILMSGYKPIVLAVGTIRERASLFSLEGEISNDSIGSIMGYKRE